MTAIERTVYRRMKRSYPTKELIEAYTPTEEECHFVNTMTRSAQHQLNLMLWLKLFPCLGYFPALAEIPAPLVAHIRAALDLPEEMIPGYEHDRTLYRHHQLVREYYEIIPYGKDARRVALRTILRAIRTMDNPADLINAALDELIKQRYELPAFITLDRLVGRVRTLVYGHLFRLVNARITPEIGHRLEQLFDVQAPSSRSAFSQLKLVAQSPTLSHLKLWQDRLTWLLELGEMEPFLTAIPPAIVKHFAAEARALDASELRDYAPAKRFTLVVCLIQQAQMRTRDDLIEMFLKRMGTIRMRAKEALQLARDAQLKTTGHLVATLTDMMETAVEDQEQDDATAGRHLREILVKHGGQEQLLQQCQEVAASLSDDHQPLMWHFYKSHRRALFQLARSLPISSTTQDQTLVTALEFILAHENSRGLFLPDTLDLSFAPEVWQHLVRITRKKRTKLSRRHLEVCIFTAVADELKAGDLAVTGSEQFADYRTQLLPWEQCEPQVAEFCQEVDIPADAHTFVTRLKTRLTEVAAQVDAAFPGNKSIEITAKGEPILKRIKAKAVPASRMALQEAIRHFMPDRSVLDVLWDTNETVHWTRHFGPISGSDPKLANPKERYVTTTFAYGTNMGAAQLAKHMRGIISEHAITFTNRRHSTSEKLDAAKADLVNRYEQQELPKRWGDATIAAADGTQIDLYPNNLVSSYHIRYGAYGGIAYHVVSSLYVALYSHFLNCGVWEGNFLIDALMANTSVIRPKVIHSDTQGQSTTIFALSYLLGIELMPRIRHWKDLHFYRPSKQEVYQHIDSLFKETIDWELLEKHWTDLMQVVLSIRAGSLQPFTLLRKLSHESRKNRLYQAFRELGRVIRTIFLLRYISDLPLREQITKTTNIVERYNQFCAWIRFAVGGLLAENDPDEMQKRVRYTDIIANALMLQNVMDLTEALAQLEQRGYPIQADDVAHLSPYMTEHLQRFGDYTLKSRPVAPLAAQDDVSSEVLSENEDDSDELSA
jgi:TnpA family transposase